jgi:hypothetical protein
MPIRIMQQPIPDTLKLLLAKLKAMGATKIVIEYCGEGDSGDIEPPEYEPATLRAHVAAHEVNALTGFVEDILEPGWEIDSGSEGWVTFDFTNERIAHVHNQRYTEYDTTKQCWNFKGDAVEDDTDIEGECDQKPEMPLLELPSAVYDLSTLLIRTETQRTLLQFWLNFPEVESLTFQGDFEYDDEGGYVRCISLAAISFVSDEAMKALRARLDKDNTHSDENPDWDELIFQNCLPDIDEDLWCEKLVQPEHPEQEIAAVNAQIREAVALAARELGGRP